MRRLISYIVMCGAILLGVGAAISPTVVKMNTDLAYSEGKTLTFRLSSKDTAKDRDGYDPEYNLTEADGYDGVEEVAAVMRKRLDNWGLSEYSVETQGYDTISVSLRASENSDTTYSYLEKYLAFNGGDLELDASNDAKSDPYTDDPAYAHNTLWTSMLDGQTASIEYITQSGVPSFPVVVVSIGTSKENIDAFTDLVTYCQKHTTADSEDESGNKTEGKTCSLILWANRHEDDYYNAAEDDINVQSRILVNESAAADSSGNSNAEWYASSDEDKETPFFQIVPPSEAITTAGKYDSTKSDKAYEAARFLMNMINAESINYQVDFLYASTATATVESLISFGDWNVSAAWSRTLIATLIAFVVIAIILALFDRMLALSIVSITAGTVFLTLASFVAFGSQFNIAAVFGLLVVAMISVFSGVYYAAKLKDELYKGRTLKKANAEAAKKTVWPTIDASVVSIIIGIFVYIFAGDLASKLGIMMVIGGFFNALLNLTLLRLSGWLLCNDNGLQSAFPKMLNVDKNRIPDMLKEEKQSYFGPYEKTDFTKGKKWIFGLMGAVVTAGIATMIAFGVINGTVYNEAAATQESTIVYIEARSDSSDTNDNMIRSISDVYDGSDAASQDSILKNIKLAGTSFGELYDDIEVSTTPLTVYSSDDQLTHYWYFFTITLTDHYDLADEYDLTVTDATDHALTKAFTQLDDAFDYVVEDYYGAHNVVVSVKNVTPAEGVPYLSKLSLGVGVGLAVVLLYMMIRYRISRGFAATLIALVAGFASVSFFVFTRISVTPIVAIGSVAVCLFSLLVSIFILQKEREIYRDSREKEKNNLAFRSLCLQQANSRSAGELIVFALVAAYLAIDFFGFGPAAYSSVYLNLILGVAFATAMSLSLLTPLSLLLAKLFSKIHIKLPQRKKKVGQLQMNQKKSAEPEEAIFIGIND